MDSNINDIIKDAILESSIDESDSNTPVDLYSELTRPMKGFVGLSQKHIEAMKLVAESVRMQLKAMNMAYGLNIEDENFRETPERIAKMMILETCAGINSEEICIQMLSKTFPAMGPNINNQLIVTTNPAIVYSICPHHFSVVMYKVWTGYIPNNYVTGISKFHRVVELYASQPLLQESYCTNLCGIFVKALEPKGVICIVEGIHQCMTTRGAKSNPESPMVTCDMQGIFLEQPSYKDDFIKLCKGIG